MEILRKFGPKNKPKTTKCEKIFNIKVLNLDLSHSKLPKKTASYAMKVTTILYKLSLHLMNKTRVLINLNLAKYTTLLNPQNF